MRHGFVALDDARASTRMTSEDEGARALVVSRAARDDAPEARAMRVREADALEEKLRMIQASRVGGSTLGRDTQGSQAGASSGEFHKYREQRRRERERLDAMEKEVAETAAREAHARRAAAREAACEAKTAKNRNKRAKAKAKREAKKKSKVEGGDRVEGAGDAGAEEEADASGSDLD